MATAYRVQYSEEAGYYIAEAEDAEDDDDLPFADGWRDSTDGAVGAWIVDGLEHAKKLRKLAGDIEDMVQKYRPQRLQNPILKPRLE